MNDFTEPKALISLRGERGIPQHVGILPIAKSILVSWGYEWALPGHGTSYSDCGSWRSKGCLNVEAHVQNSLFEEISGKVFIRRYKRTCLRAECPICYEKWAGKEASKITHRLMAWTRGKVIHVVVSPSWQDIAIFTYVNLRRKCYLVLKKARFLGGSVIFHPFRQHENTKQWYFSPHFHALGYGWIQKTKEGYEAHGWIVKNVGIRKTVSGTALYQLSHAGIHQSYHTITWFGRLSYNKLHVASRVEDPEVCPICGSKLRELWYFGAEDLPQEEGDFWLDPRGWIYKPRRFDGG